MDLGKLLDDCSTLENIITTFINSNANKQAKLDAYKAHVFSISKSCIDKVACMETQLEAELEALNLKIADTYAVIDQYENSNGTLNQFVTKASASANDALDSADVEVYHSIHDSAQAFEAANTSYAEVENMLSKIDAEKQGKELDALVDKAQKLRRDVERNSDTLQLIEQQNKYAEQEFDLILNQLPWQPMSQDRLDKICQSSDQSVRNHGDYIQIQSDQIRKLNESLVNQKEHKLKALEQLASQTDAFIRQREEALMVNRY